MRQNQLKVAACLFCATKYAQGIGQIDARANVSRRMPQCGEKTGFCLRQFSQPQLTQSKIITPLNQVRFQLQQTLQRGQGLRVFFLLQTGQAVPIQTVQIVGCEA